MTTPITTIRHTTASFRHDYFTCMCLTADCLRFLRSVTTDKARGYSDTGPCLPVAPSKEKITREGTSLSIAHAQVFSVSRHLLLFCLCSVEFHKKIGNHLPPLLHFLFVCVYQQFVCVYQKI